MKSARIINTNTTNIDNDWTNFLLGCDHDEESDHHEKTQNDTSKKTLSTKKYTTIEKKDDSVKNNTCATCFLNENNNNNNNSDNVNVNHRENYERFDFEKSVDSDIATIHNSQEYETLIQVTEVPTCSPIYISTKTKILFLNTPVDIKKTFWNIPIMPYASQCCGIIKKQIKFSCTTKEELEEIEDYTQKEIDKNNGFIETQIIEHIDNPDGRIKFKDHRKINIGLSKKDILNCRCKKKRAFFNCFVLIIRVEDENSPPNELTFKEMHIKVFNTGKLEIPGIQHDKSLENVINILIHTLKDLMGQHVDCQKDKCETVLINSNFNCGFYIDRDKLYNILKYKYRINSNYDSCSYPGIQCKFFYYIKGGTCLEKKDHTCLHIQNGQQPTTNFGDYIEISFMIFRTGSVLIVGKCEDYVLHDIYEFIKELFRVEFLNIYSHVIQPEDNTIKKHIPKLRTRTIVNDASFT